MDADIFYTWLCDGFVGFVAGPLGFLARDYAAPLTKAIKTHVA